jgi:hypothetical protein
MPRNYKVEAAREKEKCTVVKLKYHKDDPILQMFNEKRGKRGLSTLMKQVLKDFAEMEWL